MSKTTPLFIEDSNLSRAWSRAFLEVFSPGPDRIVPLVVTISGLTEGQPLEDTSIRHSLDATLRHNGCFDCETVANTLFPQSLWNPVRGREELFRRYLEVLPRLKKAEASNRYGLYFERLIAYGVERKNQLDHIISTYHRGNRRPSALQASLFAPSDHTNQRQRGFPCMQHVAFTPISDGALAVTGFYASQYLFKRAYGNYLGLCRLGHFVAHEMGLELMQMTCVTAAALRGDIPKQNLNDLLEKLKMLVGVSGDSVGAPVRFPEV